MRLLLLGYSKIAQKRLLPALTQSDLITDVDIATYTREAEVSWPAGLQGKVFTDYEVALQKSTAEVVYISTRNSEHAQWARKALQTGRHTIIDKPATLSLTKSDALVELAQKKGVGVAEANVFAYHPHTKLLKEAFTEVDSAPTHIEATFSFPPLPANNYRYQADYGGGALWDLGPYAVSPGRIFFGELPDSVTIHVTAHADTVETAFTILLHYPSQRTLSGHFGFTTGYRNQLTLIGPDVTATISRVFTPPPQFVNQIDLNQKNQAQTVTVPASDTFANFMHAFLTDIQSKNYHTWAEQLHQDAFVLDQLWQATNR